MNGSELFKASCIAAALLTPMVSQAASEQEALQACMQALTQNLAEEQGGEPVEYRSGSKAQFSKRRVSAPTTFYLDAFDPETYEVVARADCLVGRDAEVINLRALHLNAPGARMRMVRG